MFKSRRDWLVSLSCKWQLRQIVRVRESNGVYDSMVGYRGTEVMKS